MKTFRKYLILAAGIGVVTLAMSFTDTARLMAEMKPLLFRDFDAPAGRPFQAELCVGSLAFCGDRGNPLALPVATSTGEPVLRLVIEYVSADCKLPANSVVARLGLATAVGGVHVSHFFIAVPIEAGLRTSTAQETRLYADPGSSVLLEFESHGGVEHCELSLSGHLVVE